MSDGYTLEEGDILPNIPDDGTILFWVVASTVLLIQKSGQQTSITFKKHLHLFGMTIC